MADLTARLLDPETFEEALQDPDFCCCIEGRDAIRTLHARLRTAKAEGAEEAYGDIKEQAEDLRKEGGIRASLLRLLTEECVSRAAAIRKGIAAQSLAPSKCECHIERNPSRMSAAALESGASAEIVGPLCAFCRANARKPPAPGATDGERLDWLEKHGSEIDRPVEHETGVKHTGLCWYPDPFEDKELFIQGENLRAAIDAAIRAERGGK